MRKPIDSELLTAVVDLTVEKLENFSAYDVTSILRKRLPNYEIEHEEVKKVVFDYVKNNKYTTVDNCRYKTFSKPKSKPPIVVYDGRDPQSTVVNVVKKSVNDLTAMKAAMFSQMQNFSNTNSPFKPQAKVHPLLDLVCEYSTFLQSEGRITIPVKYFSKFDYLNNILVKRSNNKVTISQNGGGLRIKRGQRFRTLFPKSVKNVKVSVYNDRIEITPQ